MIKIISKKQNKKKKRWVTSCVLAALLAATPCVYAAPAENSGRAAAQSVQQQTSQTQTKSAENQNTAAQGVSTTQAVQSNQTNQSAANQQNQTKNADNKSAENQNTTVDTTQYYEIQSAVDNHKVLDISAGSVASGANLQIYSANNTEAQRFRFVKNSDGTYSIYTAVACRALDVAGGRTKNGTNVWQYNPNRTAAQRWQITKNNDGTVTLSPAVAKASALDVAGGSSRNGANVQIYKNNGTKAQKWILTVKGQVPNFSASEVLLCPSYTDNTVMDVSGGSSRNGANIQSYQFNETGAQKFNIKQNGDGSYSIINSKSGKAIDVRNGSKKSGANVWLYTSNGTDAQKWIVSQNGSKVSFKNRGSGLMLDVAGGSSASGANIQVYRKNGSAAQSWRIAAKDRAVTNGDDLGGSFTAMVKNVNGKVLAVSNGNVAMWVPNYTKTRAWTFVRNVDYSYTLSPLSNPNCALDIANGADADGTNVQIYKKNRSAAQKFVIKKQEDGTYTLMPENSSTRVLDVYGNSSEENTNLDLYTANGTKAQLFKIEKVDGSKFKWTERKLVVDIAERQLGTHEGTNNYTKYGVWYAKRVNDKSFEHGPWCAMFVSWCGAQAGVPSSVYYYHAYTPTGVQWYQNHNAWQWKNQYVPRAGDLVYYDWDPEGVAGHGVVDHVGLVVNYRKGMITTVEGNYRDQVKSRYINARASSIFGYGVPKY